jgi:hypothetical protein
MTNLLLATVHPKVGSERAAHSSVASPRIGTTTCPSLQEEVALRINAALRKTLAG